MKLKALIASVCVIAMSATCSAFALAESTSEAIADASVVETPADEAIEAPAIEEESVEETVIERSEKYSNEFNVLTLDYVNDSDCFYKSVKDAVADYGTDLYYPAYEGYENAFQAHIIYSARGESGEGPKVLQIEYAREDLEICWIKIGVTAIESYDLNTAIYESNGTVFYFGEYHEEGPNGYGGHIVEGILDGNCYQFFVKTVEEGKLIVDSLTKAE